MAQIFLSNHELMHFKNNLGTLYISDHIYPTRLRLWGYLSITYIQLLPTYRCLQHWQLACTRIMLMDDRKHVITLPLKGQISVWTDSDLKDIHLRESYTNQIKILSSALDHIMDLAPDYHQWLHIYPQKIQHKTICYRTSTKYSTGYIQ